MERHKELFGIGIMVTSLFFASTSVFAADGEIKSDLQALKQDHYEFRQDRQGTRQDVREIGGDRSELRSDNELPRSKLRGIRKAEVAPCVIAYTENPDFRCIS